MVASVTFSSKGTEGASGLGGNWAQVSGAILFWPQGQHGELHWYPRVLCFEEQLQTPQWSSHKEAESVYHPSLGRRLVTVLIHGGM